MSLILLLTILVPLAGAFINGVFGRWTKPYAGILASLALSVSFILGLFPIMSVLNGHIVQFTYYTWIPLGNIQIPFGLRVDSLSAIMLFVVTFVSTMIHIYSNGYMKGDPGFSRFFSYLNLFVASMLILVLADSYVLMFVGWEGVGLCSYLLIGFWYEKKSASDAGEKAFVVNRIGDAGFVIGILFILYYFGSATYTDVFPRVHSVLNTTSATIIGLALFLGAVGKSAQFPLYIWLTDAMEGPTPVSSLIHAATMVTAGVYMVARSNIIYSMAPTAQEVVASIGAFTAFYAATMALTHKDIKRILAYSTLSQLGYMFIGVGVGAYWAGIFHLMSHAFFKGLLFLGAGAVMHSMRGLLSIDLMGGLRKHMPQTAALMVIASLAIGGIPPFAGFFSKDAILAEALNMGHPVIWIVGEVTAFMTAFYMFRFVFTVFYGEEKVPGLYHELHTHEAPSVMTIPMWALGVMSIIGGWVGLHVGTEVPIEHFLTQTAPTTEVAVEGGYSEAVLSTISVIMGLLGIFVAWIMYIKKWITAESVARTFKPIYTLLARTYYVDEFVAYFIVKPFWWVSTHLLWKIVDVKIIDGGVDAVGWIAGRFGLLLRILQTGFINHYAYWVSLGAVVLSGWYLVKLI